MATNTYVALQTTTLGSAASSVSLTSIPGGYTDLVLVISNATTTTTGYSLTYGLNGDTGSNYSLTLIDGNGSVAQSARYANVSTTQSYLGSWAAGLSTTEPSTLILQFMNYSNTTTYKTLLCRQNTASREVDAVASLWRSTAAVNQIDIYCQPGANIGAGTKLSLYGIAAVPQLTAKATGGTIYYGADGYVYHKFTSSGTFTPTTSLNVDALVVGGGGGGYNNLGGGGGAGGLVYGSLALSATGYAVTIGSGGATTASGVASSISTLSGAGGGGSPYGAGLSGGSGGGGTRDSAAGGTGNTPSTSPAQGYNGGAAGGGAGYGGGGGGGAGGAGVAGGANFGGAGGIGSNAYSTWASITSSGASGYYAGGGGGATYPQSYGGGVGGAGGGGNGAYNNGGGSYGSSSNGTANTGGGGGGSSNGPTANGPSAGGSGIVIVRYLG